MATPFVQGQLRNRPMSFVIESECAHSGRPLRFELDSDLNLLSLEPGVDPYIFIPGIDLSNIQEDSIIDIF